VTASKRSAEKLIIFSLNSSKSLHSRLSVTGSPGEQRKTAIPKSVKVYVQDLESAPDFELMTAEECH